MDWSLDDQKRCVKLGNIVNPSNLEQMLLLYPGFKGTPDDQPYISLHEQLLERLLTVDDIYVIGFAFRDDFINNQFEIALRINKSLQIHCYNPIDLTSLPLKSKIQYFIRKYPTKFSYIQQGITADSENPLVLNIKNGITIN